MKHSKQLKHKQKHKTKYK